MMASMLNLGNQVKTGQSRNCGLMMGQMMGVMMDRVIPKHDGSAVLDKLMGRVNGRVIGKV